MKMKRIGMVCTAAALALGASAAERPLRVLAIGNSFSISVMKQLPEIMQSQDKYKLDITSMAIGGCTLERHVEEYEKALADPKHKPYAFDRFVSGQGRLPRRRENLPNVLAEPAYDIITIQQASPSSFRPESWTPWGDKLVEALRRKQPRAKLLIQQTWSYRADAPLLGRWKMTSEEMFEKVRATCAERAAHFGCGVIPAGEAVRIFREKTPVKFKSYSAEELKGYERPQAPSYKGDVVACYRWRKDKKTGEWKLTFDSTHLNPDGEYLQACVWYGFLLGADAEKISYFPKYLTSDEAALLRKCAAQAVAESKAREGKAEK